MGTRCTYDCYPTAAWWEENFASRFFDPRKDLPQPGDITVGLRLRLQYQDADGQWKNWSDRR